MSRVKSTNDIASIQLGLDSQWVHLDAGNTAGVTIAPRDTGSVVVLLKVIVNTAGSGSAVTITDTKTGVIANLAATATPGQYPYNLPCKGSLKVTNPGAADLTVTYKDR